MVIKGDRVSIGPSASAEMICNDNNGSTAPYFAKYRALDYVQHSLSI